MITQDIPLPPVSLRRSVGSGDEDVFRKMIQNLTDDVLHVAATLSTWETPVFTLVDAGCGCGRLAAGLIRTWKEGWYVGLDCNDAMVTWCLDHLTPLDRRFQFYHVDTRNAQYNPSGEAARPVHWPGVAAESVDLVCAYSLFTHLRPEEAAGMWAELERVLHPGGVLVATAFLSATPRAQEAREAMFPHPLGSGFFVKDPKCPEAAVAQTGLWWTDIGSAHGFDLTDIRVGEWPERRTYGFQDRMVWRKF